jgi:carboxymethylenebutenolidase
MCDADDFHDQDQHRGRMELSRRQFGALALGSGLVATLPRVADAVEVAEADVDIKTPDGVADCYFVHPAKGSVAGVIMWPDIGGLRPAFKSMAKRLAESGYAVLVPNPFYRQKKAPIVSEFSTGFSDPTTRQMMMGLMGALTADGEVSDTKTFAAWLDTQPSVNKRRKLGVLGYCMGGPFVLRGAAAVADRIGAGATFHGANLASDKPDSLHLLVPKMKGRFLIAIAESDDMRDPNAKTLLRAAFDKAKLPAEIEVYAGTMHGWCPPDSTVYNMDQAEKAWGRLLALFKTALA